MQTKSFQLKAFMFLLIISAGMISTAAQEVSIKGSVINPSQHPVGNVKVYLKSNPAVYCYSDSNGLFQLSSSATSASALVYDERISFNHDGSLQIHARQNSLHINIYDMLGRLVKEVIHRKNLSGIYRIHPGAYLNDLPEAIYIAQVRVDDYAKGIKISNLQSVNFPQGLTRIADYTERLESTLKSDAAEDDTLVFSSDFYRQATLAISSYTADVGVIQLENFGDYTVAEGLEPDKTRIDKKYGSFLHLTSEQDINFLFDFDSLCYYGEELEVKAIPVSSLEFFPEDLEFISGVHLEPSGTRFLDPVNVLITLKGPLPDSLVVFAYHNDTEDIYFLPYRVYREDYFSDTGTYYLETYLSHFSGAGVAVGWIEGMIEKLTQEELESAEGRGAYIAYQDQIGRPIRDDFFPRWADDVLSDLNNASTMADMEAALTNLAQLMAEYLLYTNDVFENSEMWETIADELSAKITDLFNTNNDFCMNDVENECVKYQLAKTISKLTAISQHFDGLQIPPIHDFCNGEITDLVNVIHFYNSVIYLKPGQKESIPYNLTNLDNDTITDKTIIWVSNDPEIVSVTQSGEILAHKEGTTRITGSWCQVENSIIAKVTEVDCRTELCDYIECVDIGAFSGKGRLKYRRTSIAGALEPWYFDKVILIDFSFRLFDYYGRPGIEYDNLYHIQISRTEYDMFLKNWSRNSTSSNGSWIASLGCWGDAWADGGHGWGAIHITNVTYHADYLKVFFEDYTYPKVYRGGGICPRISNKLRY